MKQSGVVNESLYANHLKIYHYPRRSNCAMMYPTNPSIETLPVMDSRLFYPLLPVRS